MRTRGGQAVAGGRPGLSWLSISFRAQGPPETPESLRETRLGFVLRTGYSEALGRACDQPMPCGGHGATQVLVTWASPHFPKVFAAKAGELSMVPRAGEGGG